jgi:hypothetical protein
MVVPRSAAVSLVVIVLLSCTTSKLHWHEFKPTQANFREYFEEHADELDPIEGIWIQNDYPVPPLDQVAIIRGDNVQDYEYVAVYLPRRATVGRTYERYRAIRVVFRHTPSDTLYDFWFTNVYGAEPVDEAREGTAAFLYGVLFFPVFYRPDEGRIERIWVKSYPTMPAERDSIAG